MNPIYAVPAIVWLIISALFFAGGEFLSKKFALAPSFTYIILIVAIYACGTLAWLPAILQKNNLSIIGSIWSVLSLAATVLIGTIIFSEKLSAVGVVGIVFAACAVALLSLA